MITQHSESVSVSESVWRTYPDSSHSSYNLHSTVGSWDIQAANILQKKKHMLQCYMKSILLKLCCFNVRWKAFCLNSINCNRGITESKINEAASFAQTHANTLSRLMSAKLLLHRQETRSLVSQIRFILKCLSKFSIGFASRPSAKISTYKADLSFERQDRKIAVRMCDNASGSRSWLSSFGQ